MQQECYSAMNLNARADTNRHRRTDRWKTGSLYHTPAGVTTTADIC